MSDRPGNEPPDHGTLCAALMRRQAALSLRVAAVFLLIVFGLPLLTHFAPAAGQVPVLGFPLSWFLLGLAFYPLSWALSWYFVRASEQLEAEDIERLPGQRPGGYGS
jgi:uncharacterized membrane protein (DUF485 family)